MKRIHPFPSALLRLSLLGLLSTGVATAAVYDIDESGGWTAPETWKSTESGIPLAADSLSISALAGNRTVTLRGDETNGTVSGRYDIASLSFDDSFSAYFTGVGGSGAPDLYIAGDLTKGGTGTLHFQNRSSGSNLGVHVAGDLEVQSGTLDFGYTGSHGHRVLEVAGKTTIRTGATLNVWAINGSSLGTTTLESGSTLWFISNNNAIFDVNDLSGSGAITLHNRHASNVRRITLELSTDANHALFSGSISQNPPTQGMRLKVLKEGSGRQTLTGTTEFNIVTVAGGVLEMSGASSLAGTSIELTGGILGLGTGDLNRTIGTTTDSDQVSFSGDGSGFAAYGADRTVTLNGNDGLVWGSGGFTPGSNLALGHASATHRLVLTNAISLANTSRTLTVGDGAAVVDAELSGAISSSGSGGALIKAGAGTLLLSGDNSYSGGTTVSGGTVLVSGVNGTGSGAVSVAADATLGGTGLITTASGVTIAAGGALLGGDGRHATGTLSLSGDLTLAEGALLRLTLGAGGAHSSLTRLGGTWTFADDQQVAFTLDGTVLPGAYTGLLTGLEIDPGVANWTFADPAMIGEFSWNAGSVDLVVTVVPEPGTLGLLALALGGAVLWRRALSGRKSA